MECRLFAHNTDVRHGTPLGPVRNEGEWEVENVGIAPDIEVDQDPAVVRTGRDPQLEKAIDVVLDLLEKNPPPTFKRPPYPDYKQRLPKTP